MQEVADIVANERKISMKVSKLDAEGNLDARKIKNICDHHGIRYTLSASGDSLNTIMIVLFIVGWGLESFLGLAVSWKYFIILSFIDTLLYVIIMYFCLNFYERGLCLQLVQRFRR